MRGLFITRQQEFSVYIFFLCFFLISFNQFACYFVCVCFFPSFTSQSNSSKTSHIPHHNSIHSCHIRETITFIYLTLASHQTMYCQYICCVHIELSAIILFLKPKIIDFFSFLLFTSFAEKLLQYIFFLWFTLVDTGRIYNHAHAHVLISFG